MAVVACRFGEEPFTTPSGWTLLESGDGSDGAGATYYRVASGTSADNFSPSWTNTARYKLIVCEYSGLDSTPVMEDSGQTLNMSSDVDTIGTGSATPATADGKAIAFFACAWDFLSPTIDGGFTVNQNLASDQSFRPGAAIASVDYSSTSPISATWTKLSGSGGPAFGAIAVFKDAGGGGGITGTSAITLDDVTTTSTGGLAIDASATVTIDDITTASAGELAIVATASATLDDITTTGTGVSSNSGSAAIVLDDVTASSAGSLLISGIAAATLDDVTSDSDGTSQSTGTAAATLDDVTSSAAGELAIAGSSASTLDDITSDSAGKVSITGASATTIDDITTDAVGASANTGSASVSIDDLTTTAAGALQIRGSSAFSLDDFTVDALGGETPPVHPAYYYYTMLLGA
ncbi:hypothetical protein [Stieleria maiorica]|uniref:hypothetical protein n=1 Tax=Stieleria maiorica TaxID=2795974 RepID=UPI0011CB25EB|nr:hypothetical protein [Stieleria maiorica]